MSEITIRNARENNLRALSCSVPRNQLVVVTGPSGAGKTSLVFNTIYMESFRRYAAAFNSAHLRQMRQSYKPKVDEIRGLSFARAIDRSLNNPLTTLATLTRSYDYLKALFYYFGTPACDRCGNIIHVSKRRDVLQQIFSFPALSEVTVKAPLGGFDQGSAIEKFSQLAAKGFSRIYIDTVPISLEDALAESAELEFPVRLELAIDRLKLGDQSESRLNEALNLAVQAAKGQVTIAVKAEGKETTLSFNEAAYCIECEHFVALPTIEDFSYSQPKEVAVGVDESMSFAARMLHSGAASYKLGELSFAAALSVPITELVQWLRNLPLEANTFSGELFDSARNGLERVLLLCSELGLSYLALGRQSTTLSAGELQRAKLLGSISRQTRGILYCLDEPTMGLHPDDVEQLLSVLRTLVSTGNSVIAVEHHPQFLADADYLLELGPGAGKHGGNLLIAGPQKEVGRELLSAKLDIPTESGSANGSTTELTDCLHLRGLRHHNLRDIQVDIPLGGLVCVTGVSGSGKSSLISDSLLPALEELLSKSRKSGTAPEPTSPYCVVEGWQKLKGVLDITRLPLTSNRRSTVATAADVLEPLRNLFAMIPEAEINALTPAHFSFNTKVGACKMCGGEGSAALADDQNFYHRSPCSECKGTRFDPSVLGILWKGKSIADVLNATVEESIQFFSSIPNVRKPLQQLHEVGLSYLNLSQETDSLSTGELQRLKIVSKVGKRSAESTLFAFDEPTRGLARNEVAALLRLLRTLISRGASVIAIEHNVDFIRSSDYIIDLGPGAGAAGGNVVAAGSLSAIKSSSSKLAKYL